MALSAGQVSLGVKPDTSKFGSDLTSSIGAQSGLFDGIGKKVGGLIVGGIAALGVGKAIGSIFSTGFDEAKDASAGIAQLTAGIKSTGNAANVSVDGMENLASSIQGMSGQTDDSIVKAEQLLLTFTNIKNSGPDKIFDQATQAAADMAAKMGGDASSNAILLGKALNDPVKGVTALTRVGVSFTQAQKDSIAAMVKSGDTMGAQKLILGELNTEFGGAAKAAGESLPGQLARTRRAFEDITQAIVQGFLPVIQPALNVVIAGLQMATPYVQVFATWMGDHVPAAMARVHDAITGTIALLTKGDFTSAFKNAFHVEEDSPIVDYILNIRDAFLHGGILEAAQAVFAGLGDWISGGGLQTIFAKFTQARAGLFAAVLTMLPGILDAIVAIVPMVVSSFGDLVQLIAGAIVTAVPLILGAWVQVFGGIATAIGVVLPQVVSTLTTALPQIIGAIVAMIPQLITAAIGFYQGLVDALVRVIPALIAAIVTLVPLLIGALISALPQLITGAITLFLGLVTALTTIIPPLITAIVDLVPVLIQAIVGALPALIDGAIKLFMGLVTGLVTAIPVIVTAVVNAIPVIITAIVGAIPALIAGAIKLFLGIITALTTAIPLILVALISALPKLITAVVSALPQLITGSIQLFLGIVTGLIRALPQIIGAIIGMIPQIVGALIGAIPQLIDAGIKLVGGLIKGIGQVAGQIGAAFTAPVKSAINGVIGLANSAIDGINSIGGGVGIHLSHIPMLAKGGTLTSDGSVIVGENGPELLTLPRGASVNPNINAGNNAAGKDRPIYADGVGLIAWIRELANGEARLVWAQGEQATATAAGMGWSVNR